MLPVPFFSCCVFCEMVELLWLCCVFVAGDCCFCCFLLFLYLSVFVLCFSVVSCCAVLCCCVWCCVFGCLLFFSCACLFCFAVRCFHCFVALLCVGCRACCLMLCCFGVAVSRCMFFVIGLLLFVLAAFVVGVAFIVFRAVLVVFRHAQACRPRPAGQGVPGFAEQPQGSLSSCRVRSAAGLAWVPVAVFIHSRVVLGWSPWIALE